MAQDAHRLRNPQPPRPAVMLRTRPTEGSLRSLLEDLGERARAYRFEVAPNPCVGAAVLSGDQVVSEGFHQVWGGPHAEINALAAAAVSDREPELWDTLAVTLEPCSSEGKTGPCTAAVLQAGIQYLVAGEVDPDPRHAGQGLQALVDAGVDVDLVRNRADLRATSPQFLSWIDQERIRRPRPWLIAKWAQTRTGQLTPPEDVGEGRWISGPTSQREVHVLRSRVDAIVTGIGTVMKDDPRLTVRPPADTSAQPLRVVLDSHLRIPLGAAILREPTEQEGAGQVHILCRAGADAARHRALVEGGAAVRTVRASEDGRLSLPAVLDYLWEVGARRVMLEAGPKLQRAFSDEGLVDQLRIYSGSINGGRGESLADLITPHRLRDVIHREVGADAVLEAFL